MKTWPAVCVGVALGGLVIVVGFGLDQSSAAALPEKVLHAVPFTCQAPNGEWSDPVQADGCEEACVLMLCVFKGVVPSLDSSLVIAEMRGMAAYEELVFGTFVDTGLDDTVELWQWYYHSRINPYSFNIDPRLKRVAGEAVSVEAMKRDLAAGNVLLVPVNGQKLNHPYYKPPGPLVHMVLVIGYDDESGAFIINDPGTRHGQAMQFSYEVFLGAMGDYRTGDHANKPDDQREKAYVAVGLVKRHPSA